MADIGTMTLALNAKTADFVRGMTEAQKKTEALSGALTGMGKKLSMGLTLPLAAAAAASVHFATKLNAAMANVGSLGVGVNALKVLKKEMQDTAIAVGGSSVDMAEGLYQVVSAFGHTAESGKMLAINAKAAKAGLTDVSTAVDLTSAVTKAYGDTSAKAVQKVADLAFVTVKLGKTEFPALAHSLMRVTSVSKNLGISQEEMFATFATLTGVTGEAAQVSTQYQGVLQALMSPSAEMEKLLEKQGVASGKALVAAHGYQGALLLIAQHAEQTGMPLQKLVSSIEGQIAVQALAGEQTDDYVFRLAEMSKGAGAADAALAAQTTGLNAIGFMMEQVGTKVMVLAERIGDELLPVVGGIIDIGTPVLDWALDMIDLFGKLSTPVKVVAGSLVGLVAAVGPVLIGFGFLTKNIGMIKLAIKMLLPFLTPLIAALGAISAPVWITIAAIAGLAAAFIFFGDEIIYGVAYAIDNFVGPVLNGMIEGINWATNGINNALGTSIPQMELFATTGNTLGNKFSSSMHGMKDSISNWTAGMLLAETPIQEFEEKVVKVAETAEKAGETISKIPIPEPIDDSELDLSEAALTANEEAWKQLGKTMGTVLKNTKLSFSSVKDTIRGAIDATKGFIKELLKIAAKKMLMGVLNSLTGGGFSAGTGILGGAKKWLGFAEGGIVKEPTAMIGLKTGGMGIMSERGPEAIVPLGGGRSGGGGMSLTVNVYGSVGVEDIGDQLVRTLRTRGI